MLSETDLSIETIAHQVGYRSPSRFYEVVRKHHGMTPTDFRWLSRELRPLPEEDEQADRRCGGLVEPRVREQFYRKATM